MAATVLSSPRAIHVSIHVVEAFVRLRERLALNHELARKFSELERKIITHDAQIQAPLIVRRGSPEVKMRRLARTLALPRSVTTWWLSKT
jgi:hypothetical protein